MSDDCATKIIENKIIYPTSVPYFLLVGNTTTKKIISIALCAGLVMNTMTFFFILPRNHTYNLAIENRLIRNKKDSNIRYRNEEAENSHPYVDTKPNDPLYNNNDYEIQGESNNDNIIDFFIAGFPKCGTTSLLYAFGKHNETSISAREYCAIDSSSKTESQIISTLLESLDNLPSSLKTKKGIKCPMSIRDMRGIKKIDTQSPGTKIIIGMRHPVLFFQSFYNYRITELHNKGLKGKVPPPDMLVGNKHWKRVSTDLARYELSLMQLGKTNLSSKNRKDLIQRKLDQGKTRLKVFIYNMQQLGDMNTERATRFRNDMQDFLGLSSSIDPFPKENVGWGKIKKFKEHIDICEEKFTLLRSLLLSQSKETRRWIKDEFIGSEDVFVGGETYFLELMEEWDIDPCLPKPQN